MVVYKITCTEDNRMYIGASKNPKNRMREHFLHLSRGNHHNQFLQRAYNKYGKDSFSHEIIERCNTEEQMWKRETEIIEELSNLYNAMPGGVRGPSMFGADNPKYGKTISENQRRLQSEAMSGENHPFYGIKRPDHSKRMKENNPMHTHGIDFSGSKNPNAKHFDKIEKITILREEGLTWPQVAKKLNAKSDEYLRRFYKKFKG
jgi:group I intron endonuclease